jgi:hypothetical protein
MRVCSEAPITLRYGRRAQAADPRASAGAQLELSGESRSIRETTYLIAATTGRSRAMMDCIRMQATLAIVLWARAMTGTLTT